MKKIFLLILLAAQVLTIFCHQEQNTQYLITFRWPADSLGKNQREYQQLKPGLQIVDSNGVLIGMVSQVSFLNDSVDVRAMLDRQIQVGSEISYSPCPLSPRFTIEFSKQHKYYCPRDIIHFKVPPMPVVCL